MPYEFTSSSEEFAAYTLIILSGIGLFFIIRFIEFVSNYSHIIYLEKPLKCKKCHKTLTTFRSCTHATHSRLTPFIMAGFFISMIPFWLFIGIPYADTITPTEPADPICGEYLLDGNASSYRLCVKDYFESKNIFSLIDKWINS